MFVIIMFDLIREAQVLSTKCLITHQIVGGC